MVGLRNILVHGYARINKEIVVKASERLPEDSVRLAKEILSSARPSRKDSRKNNEDLTKRLRKVLKNRVKLAFLFGSKVKGYSLKGDVDVALYFDGHPDPYEVGRLVYDLQESLEREDVDALVFDLCDDIALAYEAVWGRPILGEEAEILKFGRR
ncbi:MAG: HepT-like ribonuclease domain-containing protein [Candidatus Bathyarchaeia archaeon]